MSYDKDEELFKAYLNRFTMKYSHWNARHRPSRIRYSPDRLENRQLSIKSNSSKHSNHSTMSTITDDK